MYGGGMMFYRGVRRPRGADVRNRFGILFLRMTNVDCVDAPLP